MVDPVRSRTTASGVALIVSAMIAVVVVVVLVVRGSQPDNAEPSGPSLAVIDIVSDPVGASIYHADGGALMGVAPITVSLPQSNDPLVVVVKHEGYQDRRVTVPLFSKSGRVDVALTVIGGHDPVVKELPDGFVP